MVDQWLLNGTAVQNGGTGYTANNITANATVQVTFKPVPVQYAVTPGAGANGSISPNTVQMVNNGGSAAFTATPNSGFTVNQWLVNSVAVQTGGTGYTVSNVTANTTVQVTFSAVPYTVTPSAGANGTINPSTVQTVNSGGSAAFTATPNSGYMVDQWFVNGASVQPGGTAYTVSNVTATTTVQVTFKVAPVQYPVTPSAGANGSISPSTVQTVSSGGSVSFTAAPGTGYRVSQWLVNGVPVQVGGATYTGLSAMVGPVSASTTVQVTFTYAPGAHWQSIALTAAANAAIGKRTGVAHASWPLYYYKGTDNNIWCVYYGGGSAWTQVQLTTAANVDDWLTFLPTYNMLCYRSTDGNLYAVYLSGSTWVTANLSSVTANVAGDIAVDPAWNLIYYRAADGSLWGAYVSGGQWVQASITAASSLPANVAGDLSVDAGSHLLYYRGTDNHLYTTYYGGGRWNQAKLSNTPNIGGAVTADSGYLVYYRNNTDNTPWATYWNGVAWQQVQLDFGTTMSTATSLSSLYALHTWLYLDANGQCGVEYVNGNSWAHAKLGDGGSSLVGGLSVQHGTNWAFAQRSDGHVLIFYYQ